VRSAEAFVVSVLASDQQQVAEYFASRGRTPQSGSFATVPTTTRQTGAPIIDGRLSWFDRSVEDLIQGGDPEILVGRVAAAGGRTREPLVYLGHFRPE
jgi:flavin reductase (DIM6/NTAB) family NADH-FMN oxidoreductase RutF